MHNVSRGAAEAYNNRNAAAMTLESRKFDILSSVPTKAANNLVKVWRKVAQLPGAFEFATKLEQPTGKAFVEQANDLARQMMKGSGYKIEVGHPKDGFRYPVEITDKSGLTLEAQLEFAGMREHRRFVVHASMLEKGTGAGKAMYQFAQAVADPDHRPRAGVGHHGPRLAPLAAARHGVIRRFKQRGHLIKALGVARHDEPLHAGCYGFRSCLRIFHGG